MEEIQNTVIWGAGNIGEMVSYILSYDPRVRVRAYPDDDPPRYRDKQEVDAWKAKDPLIRLRAYLEQRGVWDDDMQVELQERAKVIVREVVKTAEGIEPPVAEDMFDHTFAEIPLNPAKQRATLRTSSIGQNPDQIGLKAQSQNA